MAEDRIWIRDLHPGSDVEESYAVRSRELRQRRGGGPYLAGVLADRTGQVAALAWENAEELFKIMKPGAVVRIRGQVQRYNQRLQVVIRQARLVDPEEVDERLFIRSSSIDPDLLWNRLMGLVEKVGDERLRQLLFRIFSDPGLSERFKASPAARSMHHAYRSGLMEHTVSMTTVAKSLAEHYRLNVDLVVAGCLLHDLGKVWELEPGPSIEYTDDGRLLGHLSMEVLFVDRQIGQLDGFPEETRRQLLHILLAHHGEYAYGSPRRPKTPEAQLVHMVDNLDAKISGMLDAIGSGGETEEAWTAYQPLLERYVYRRRLNDD
ncbi:MAG: HD domain-containing protein [Acidobacteria bacterium]|nr:HD domain-containing protein [Acidobacteriota bacterium]